LHNDIDRDLYEILGVPREASPDQIKTAYRARARECHPDVAHDDPDGEYKFKELTFAYEVLSDADKRRTYDNMGLDGLRRGAGVEYEGFGSISDLFDVFFGDGFTTTRRQRGGRQGRVRGRDMETVVAVSLQEVLSGVDRDVEVTRMATCDKCAGTGMKPGTGMTTCVSCQGAGEVRTTQRNMFGTFIRSHPCQDCGGAGQMITEPCEDCRGDGRVRVTENLQVTVPPGVERGDRLRLRGKGEGGLRGGPTGDLYVLVDVRGDSGFERDGTRLYSRFDVGMIDAALGTEVEIPTVDGEFTLKVPAGTQPGDILKAKGQGLPPRHGGKRGDLYVRVDVTVPKKLSGEQRKLLESARDAEKAKARK